MAQVVDTRTFSTGGLPESGDSNQSPEMSARGDIAICALLMPEQRRLGIVGRACFRTGLQIIAQCGHCRVR